MVTVVGKDPSVIKRVTCHNCSSILEYTQNEVRRATSKDYTGCVDVYKVINCPRCYTCISVS